jgi:hypothetical protein
MRRYIATLLVIASLVGTTGCFVGRRYHDRPRRDYRHSDDRGYHADRGHLAEQRYEAAR